MENNDNYDNHLKNTARKLQSRKNIIKIKIRTRWVASTISLRTAALALVNSIDTQLNTTIRLITDTLLSTKTNQDGVVH